MAVAKIWSAKISPQSAKDLLLVRMMLPLR